VAPLEFYSALPEVDGVRGVPWPDVGDHDGLDVFAVAEEILFGQLDGEGVAAVGQGVGEALGLGPAGGFEIGGVELLDAVLGAVSVLEGDDVGVGVGSGDEDGAVAEEDGGRVVHAWDGGRRETVGAPALALGALGVIDDGCQGWRLCVGCSRRHPGCVAADAVSGRAIAGAVDDENGEVREDEGAAHDAALGQGVEVGPDGLGIEGAERRA